MKIRSFLHGLEIQFSISKIVSTTFICFLTISLVGCYSSEQITFTESSNQLNFDTMSHVKLKEAFFSFYSQMEPEDLSSLGFHDNDNRWKNWSSENINKEVAFYKSFIKELGKRVPKASNDQILDLESMNMVAKFKVRFYDQQRHLYNIWVSKAPIATLKNQSLRATLSVNNDCTTTIDLWLSIIERVEKIPAFLDLQEGNLQQGLKTGLIPNRFIFEVVMEDIKQCLSEKFFEKLPDEAETYLDQEQLSLFREACKITSERYIDHYNWLNEKLRPLALVNSNYKLGRSEYESRLKELFFINLTPDSLYELAWSELKRINQRMQKIASQVLNKPIDSAAKLADAMKEIRSGAEQGTVDLSFYKKIQKELIETLNEKELFDRYNEFKLSIVAMPDGLGARSAATNWPALLHDSCAAGVFLIALPNPLPAKMGRAITAHEGIPGHYYQSFVWQMQFNRDPAPVRFLLVQDDENFVVNSWATMINIEGWGLYIERLLEAEGFYKDPVEQLEALALIALRAVRVVNDIGLHVQDFSIEEAAQNLYTYAFADNMETATDQIKRRYAILPMQGMTYLLGALQIEDLQRKWLTSHPDKTVKDFHRAFLLEGPIAPMLIQRKMLEQ